MLSYVILPDKYDINEYDIMEEFAIGNTKLENSIRGKGAFRRFEDTVYELGREKEWYKFRDEALLGIAKGWCEKNNICYEEQEVD